MVVEGEGGELSMVQMVQARKSYASLTQTQRNAYLHLLEQGGIDILGVAEQVRVPAGDREGDDIRLVGDAVRERVVDLAHAVLERLSLLRALIKGDKGKRRRGGKKEVWGGGGCLRTPVPTHFASAYAPARTSAAKNGTRQPKLSERVQRFHACRPSLQTCAQDRGRSRAVSNLAQYKMYGIFASLVLSKNREVEDLP